MYHMHLQELDPYAQQNKAQLTTSMFNEHYAHSVYAVT